MPAQMVTVIITRNVRDNGRRDWIGAQTELDSLVRRMGFDLILQATGTSPVEQLPCYQVTGTREGPLGDQGMDAVRRELGNLVYVHSIPALSVGFGSIDQHLDL